MNTGTWILISLIVLSLIIIFIIIFRTRINKKKKLISIVSELDIKKNILDSMPILVELSKIEDIAKSEQLEEKVHDFKFRYDIIKTKKIVEINDKILELDYLIESKQYKTFYDESSDIEILIYEVDFSLNKILQEINEISSYEEKYRNIITQLKSKYRYLEKIFNDKESLLNDFVDIIRMQFENIEKRFSDFDIIMEEKLYNEVSLVVNAIDAMINHLEVVINELPDILLLTQDLIPSRIKELNKEYNELIEKGYPLAYLNFEDNINDAESRIKEILDRAKVLNIDYSLFDSRNILEYLDNIFKDFEKEKIAKEEFDSINKIFNNKVNRMEKIINGLYDQMDDIKAMYGLKEKDLDIIDKINLRIASIVKEYKNLLKQIKKGKDSYLKSNIDLYELIQKVNDIDIEFEKAIKSLGSIYDDEVHAKEQLVEIKKVLKECKEKVRKYHLPIISDKYFIELNDVYDAIREVEKELDIKPIIIKTLNIRVDTARDLIFKLYKTTNEMIEKAHFTELLLVYGNRYRDDVTIDRGLTKTEMLFFKGEYEESFNLVLKVLELKEKGVINNIKKLCEK